MPSTVGEVRESDHIDCLHWNHGVKLTASKAGDRWRIKNHATGEVGSFDTLEYTTWGGGKWYAAWQGDKIRHTNRDTNEVIPPSDTLNYLGRDTSPVQEQWKATWNPKKRVFRHEREA